jgi:trimeric autotransporter adhesin
LAATGQTASVQTPSLIYCRRPVTHWCASNIVLTAPIIPRLIDCPQVAYFSSVKPINNQIAVADRLSPPVTPMSDLAGNSLATARSISLNGMPSTFNDTVGVADLYDFYRFTVAQSGALSVSLNNLQRDADLYLVQDLNGNGQFDFGETIASSTLGGTGTDTILRNLEAGTYYLGVLEYGGETTYNLQASFQTDNAGNTLAAARSVLVGATPTVMNDAIGNGDSNDYYRFSVSSPGQLNLSLAGLSADADVELLNADGVRLTDSTAGGSNSESIIAQLTAGTYYVRVLPYQSAVTTYSLSLGFTASDFAGNTLATARSVAIDSKTQTFNDAIGNGDANDYYRFTLTDSHNFQLNLTGLTSDADVQLLNSAGTAIGGSYGIGSSESIAQQLTAGTYYVRVYPYSGSTSYNLSLTATPIGDDTLGTARLVNLSTTPLVFNDAIGNGDTNDYYRFTLADSRNFQLNLTGLTSDADVQLLNSAGTAIGGSYGIGSSESIAQQLTAGTYYVRVYPYSGSTNYTLSLAATTIVPPISTPIPTPIPTPIGDDTLATARLVNLSTTPLVFNDAIGNGDSNDYYRFTLTDSRNIQFNLSGMTADGDMQLLNSAGTVISYPGVNGSGNETIGQQLTAGTYYLRVFPYSGSTSYSLSLAATSIVPPTPIPTPTPTPTPIPTPIGDDTLATARLVNLTTTPLVFNDAIGNGDLNDYYRFTLTDRRNVQFNLSGMTADGDMQLLNSAGTVISYPAIDGPGNETIGQRLDAGTYYLRVFPYSGSTNYNLSLTANLVDPNFDSVYGYGLVNAATAVAQAAGQPTFAPVSNTGYSWENNLINAPEAWARGYTGQGIVVAVVDTGVDTNHIDLRNNIWVNSGEIAGNNLDDDNNGYIDDINGWDFVGNDSRPLDSDGHGTHVAGTIAATNNQIGVTGVAYGSRIMAVRVLDNNGGTSSNVAAGIRYATNNGARVINLSLGGSYSSEISSAVQYAYSRGSIVVMAAGNAGASQPGNPAREATRWGLSVGAVDRNSTIASFSNRAGTNSQMRHIVAPGVDIYSTTPNNSYDYLDGTSMAAPQVSGLVALMLSANNSLTPDQVFQTITGTATRLVA